MLNIAYKAELLKRHSSETDLYMSFVGILYNQFHTCETSQHILVCTGVASLSLSRYVDG